MTGPHDFNFDAGQHDVFRYMPSPGEFGAHWSSESTRAPGSFVVRYPGWFRRVLGGTVDYVIPFIIATHLGGFGILLLAGFVLWNSVWEQGRTGQSAGKMLLGMQLCYLLSDSRDPYDYYCMPGVGRCLFRQMCHALDMPFFFGFFRAAFNGKGRTYADSCARTVVIRDSRVQIWDAEAARLHRARGGLR